MRCIKISPLPSCKWLTYYQSGLIEGRINRFSIIGTRTKQMDLHRFHLDDQHWLHNTACVLNSLPPPRHVPTSASMAAKGTPLTKQIQLPSHTVESGQEMCRSPASHPSCLCRRQLTRATRLIWTGIPRMNPRFN